MEASENDIGPYDIIPISQEYEDVTIYKIHRVLKEDLLTDVKKEVDSVPLGLNSNDLGQFLQSNNLDRQRSITPALGKLVGILKTKVRQTVEELFNIETKPQITATISKYSKGDYLLCHDDRLGTRAVAFVFYLRTLTPEDGGSLRFFDLTSNDDPIAGSHNREIKPADNSIVVFRVDKTSYHEVEQIFTDAERISINGWFHYSEDNGDDDVVILSQYSKSPIVNLTMTVFPVIQPTAMLSPTLLSQNTLKDMETHLKTSKEMAVYVKDCLKPGFYKNCLTELQTEDLMWEVKGPANYRFYESLDFEVEGPHISFGESLYYVNNLVDFLLSAHFLQTLSKVTGAEYAVLEDKNVPPTCMIEVQRWKEGNYSMLTDNDIERNMSTLMVTIFFQVQEEMLGKATSDTDVSGLVVVSSKFPVLPKAYVKELRSIKLKRIQNAYLKKQKKTRMTRRQKPQENNRLMSSINAIVQEKIDKIQRYRKAKPDEFLFLTPQDNVMIISLGTKTVMRHTSYIKKKDFIHDPQICYYAVSVTYFTT